MAGGDQLLQCLFRILDVQVNQNLARLRAVARTDDSPVLQFIHDPRGAAVAEAQTPLKQASLPSHLSLSAQDVPLATG